MLSKIRIRDAYYKVQGRDRDQHFAENSECRLHVIHNDCNHFEKLTFNSCQGMTESQNCQLVTYLLFKSSL